MYCPSCGEQNSDTYAFCQKCGAKLGGSPVGQQAAPAPVQQQMYQGQQAPVYASQPGKMSKNTKVGIIVSAAAVVILSTHRFLCRQRNCWRKSARGHLGRGILDWRYAFNKRRHGNLQR